MTAQEFVDELAEIMRLAELEEERRDGRLRLRLELRPEVDLFVEARLLRADGQRFQSSMRLYLRALADARSPRAWFALKLAAMMRVVDHTDADREGA